MTEFAKFVHGFEWHLVAAYK